MELGSSIKMTGEPIAVGQQIHPRILYEPQ
jgi:hypothetical protein